MPLRISLLAGEDLQAFLAEAVLSGYQDCVLVKPDENPDLIFCFIKNAIDADFSNLCKQHGIKCIGVSKSFFRLQKSKFFAKMFSVNNGILTPKLLSIECQVYPQVVKLDDAETAGGVGVVDSDAEKKLFTTKFAGKKYFVEEYLTGENFSPVIYYSNGKVLYLSSIYDRYNEFPPQKQEKFQALLNKIENALKKEKADFSAVFSVKLIWCNNEYFLLGYNFVPDLRESEKYISVLKNELLTILRCEGLLKL